MLNHLLFLVFDQYPKKEGLVEMEYEEAVHETDAVLRVERINFPVSVSNWVLKESSNVFEGSPSLCIVSWLLCCVDKLSEISISCLQQGPK